MILILLNWVYIFFICLGMGTLFNSFLRPKQPLFFLLLYGLFAEMLLIHFYALLFPINSIFYLVNFSLATICIFFRKNLIGNQIRQDFQEWKNWKKSIRILGVLILVLILMQSSTKPFIVDNETYYIQSIKWLNDFGIVKGLANLHIYLGQMSGWHVLQSGFNFGFNSQSLNDLNGFFLLICSIYFLNHLNQYFKSKVAADLFLGIIPFGNLFFFQFVSAPSPDLPVFLISQIIFYLFYHNYKINQNDFRQILILSVFLILVKITVFPILILPFILAVKHNLIKKEFGFSAIFGMISLIAFCLKNYIISGYLMYPTDFLGNIFSPDWKIPPELLEFYYMLTRNYSITSLQNPKIEQLSTIEYFKYWLLEPGLRSIFNKLIIILLVIFPVFIRKNKTLFWLYVYALIQFIVLFSTSPQYRFFIPLIIGMNIYILIKFLSGLPQMVIPITVLFSILPVATLVFSLNTSNFRNSSFTSDELETFKIENILIPSQNSRYNFIYEKVKDGNLIYNSPGNEKLLLWMTANGELPCVNKKMLKHLKKRYKIRPQLRTENLKDGFYSEKLDE